MPCKDRTPGWLKLIVRPQATGGSQPLLLDGIDGSFRDGRFGLSRRRENCYRAQDKRSLATSIEPPYSSFTQPS